MREQFLPNIYNQPWYNGDSNTEDMYIANKNSILIGMPWMRQLRIGNSKRCFKFSTNPEFSFFLSSLIQSGRPSIYARKLTTGIFRGQIYRENCPPLLTSIMENAKCSV